MRPRKSPVVPPCNPLAQSQGRLDALRRPFNRLLAGSWFDGASRSDLGRTRALAVSPHSGAERALKASVQLSELLHAGLTHTYHALVTLEVPRPLARVLALGLGTASLACGLVPRDGGNGGRSTPSWAPLDPELAKYKQARPARPTPWSYVLPIDHGVRADKSGEGSFRAPRFHGEHNGIDLLAPVGTPVFAACSGKALASTSPSFGHWVQVICPVPSELWSGRGAEPWASFFYAHLKESLLPEGKWIDVARGAPVGSVGKTGNALEPSIQPHVHLELIIQKNQRSAMDERHLGADQSSSGAAKVFAERIEDTCLDPFGFHPKSHLLTRGRRLDPFVALTCLSSPKPNFERAPEPLGFASTEWSRFYIARRFNVNLGLDN